IKVSIGHEHEDEQELVMVVALDDEDEDRSRTKGLDPKDMEHDETNNHEFKSARGPKGLPYGELITGTRDFIEEGKR
ncbi:hypothetical protein B296_00052876, partial [Ensete ventricosum]